MKQSKVIEIAYKTIKDSLEWGLNNDCGDDFAQYVDGVVGMTDALLEEMNQTVEPNTCKCDWTSDCE